MPYLLSHRLHTLKALRGMGLPELAKKTALEGFEAHMLQRAVKNAIHHLQREERDREYLRKQAAQKDEARRMQEAGAEPCGGAGGQ